MTLYIVIAVAVLLVIAFIILDRACFVVSIGLCVPRRWKGHLFGNPCNARISIWHCGLFSLIRFDTVNPVQTFSDFLMANESLEDYLAVRRPQVRARLRRQEAKARAQARAQVQDGLRMWRDNAMEANERANVLQHRVYALETTVRTLRGMGDDGK